jgi:large subunit ribosomal protein L5
MARVYDQYNQQILPELKKELGRDNPMSLPKLDKIVISMGLGKALGDAGTGNKAAETKRFTEAIQHLTTISGQKPQICKAKKSVSNFKVREGWDTGLKVTLRGQRMYEFIDRLISIAIPRVRDFRGLNPNSFDGRGNYGMGLSEVGVFPEINPDRVSFQQGLNITICTTAHNDSEARQLLTLMGMPFKN